MNVVRRQSDQNRTSSKRIKGGDSLSSPNNRINFYLDVPKFELSVDEFEELALARLKILRKIEYLKSRGLSNEAYRNALDGIIKQCLPSPPKPSTASSYDADVASHFILRAAYCRTDELRRWFLTTETALFRHRLEKYSHACVAADMESMSSRLNVELTVVSDEEKMKHREDIIGSGSATVMEFQSSTFYKIPFLQALDLIRSRSVFLLHGMAFVPLSLLVTIVASRFRAHLSKSLVHAYQAMQSMHDSRVAPLLQNMNLTNVGKNYDGDQGDNLSEKITLANVDTMAQQSMPLCMKMMYRGLKRDHKLKYDGRVQFVLFLKGAGMSMDDTISFFETQFTKIMTPDEFRKQYVYSIRHLHGKEGKRVSKSPYNCMKIVMGPIPMNPDQHHGCPFKHYDQDRLASLLSTLKIDKKNVDKIMSDKVRGHYNLACVKHFEAVHPGYKEVEGIQLDEVGNHPNAWFQGSRSYYEKKNNVKNTI